MGSYKTQYGQPGRYNSVLPTIPDGAGGALAVDANGKLLVSASFSGTSTVQGNVASGVADSGNPVKVGGIYMTTRPTFTDGQRGDIQIGTRGSVNVTVLPPDNGSTSGWKADNVDAVAVSSTVDKFTAITRGTVYNGTTWDRMPGNTTGVFIGSHTPGTAAANLGKAEDAVHTSGDVGVMALTVRADTAAATAGTTGDYQPQITDALGLTWMREYYAPVYEDNTAGVAKVEQRFSYSHIGTGQATTVIKSGAGFLHSITLNGAATATNVTTVYDNTAGSGTVIAIPAATTATVPTTLTYDVAFSTGLTILTATANGADMTVSYR